MSKTPRVTLIVISLILFLGIPSLSVVRIWDASSSGDRQAQRHFSATVQEVRGAAEFLEQAEYGRFAESLRPIVEESRRLSLLLVMEQDGRIDYGWSRSRSRLPQDISEVRLEPNLSYHEPWERQLDARVARSDSDDVIIAAVYETLDPGLVFQTLRDALLTIITFALLVLIVLIASLRPEAATDDSVRTDTNTHRVTPDQGRQSAGSPAADSADEPATPSGRAGATHGPPSHDQPQQRPEETRSAQAPPAASADPQEAPTPDVTASEQAGEEKTAAGQTTPAAPSDRSSELHSSPEGSGPPLVSPDSGLSFSAHLPRRLSLELERAAENDLDLALFMIQIRDAEDTPVTSTVLGSLILEQFPFEDLAFEYSDGRVCVILPGTDLDTAMRKGQRFITLLKRHELGSYKVNIGASSRNGRLVESDRLLTEAREALSRTDDESTMVGFRPDPDRYRSYIATRMGG